MPSRTSDLTLAGHAFLAGSMALWRAVEGTPWLTSERGGGVLGHPAGEALLAAWMLVAVATLAAVAVGTIVDRRTIPLVLAALLVASLSMRTGFDAFDLAYLLAVPVSIVLHVDRRCGATNAGCGATNAGRGATNAGRGATNAGRGATNAGRGASTAEGDTLEAR